MHVSFGAKKPGFSYGPTGSCATIWFRIAPKIDWFCGSINKTYKVTLLVWSRPLPISRTCDNSLCSGWWHMVLPKQVPCHKVLWQGWSNWADLIRVGCSNCIPTCHQHIIQISYDTAIPCLLQWTVFWMQTSIGWRGQFQPAKACLSVDILHVDGTILVENCQNNKAGTQVCTTLQVTFATMCGLCCLCLCCLFWAESFVLCLSAVGGLCLLTSRGHLVSTKSVGKSQTATKSIKSKTRSVMIRQKQTSQPASPPAHYHSVYNWRQTIWGKR